MVSKTENSMTDHENSKQGKGGISLFGFTHKGQREGRGAGKAKKQKE
jgi:hypothetical protein